MFGDSHDQTLQARRFSRRAVLLGLGQIAAFGALGARLYQLQVLEEQRYALLAEENRVTIQMLAPARGRILDRFGTVLAGSREGYRVVVVPSLAGDVRGVLGKLAQIVPLSEEERDRIAQRARRTQPHVPVVVASDLTFQQLAAINVLAPQLPGIQTEIAGRREYFHGRAMSHVVGHVGSLERLAMDDDPVLRLPGMKIGKTGVERGMEERLRGVGGSVRHEVDSRGRIIRSLETTESLPGGDVVLTVDTDLQSRVMQRLSQERRAACVAMEVNTGEVVALASVPTFDQNEVSGLPSASPARRQGLQSLLATANNPMFNRAIRGLYPPGSTFKMVTALAALEAGVIDLKEKLPCSGAFEYYGQTFRCWRRSGHGSCDFHRALRESCDCYFYESARRTGIDAISAMGRRLGFGQTFATAGIALQKSGVMPSPEWKQSRFARPWVGGETVLAGIGQGYVLTTPLQLAVMSARIASGMMVRPTLVRPDAGSPSPAFAPLGVDRRHLDAVRRAMVAVVSEDGGTGGNARLDDSKMQVAGKTGTSQVSRKSSETSTRDLSWEERDHALFVAYFPAAKPRFAVSAVVEHAGGGGAAAAPLVREVIELLIDRDPFARPAYPEAAGKPAAASGRG